MAAESEHDLVRVHVDRWLVMDVVRAYAKNANPSAVLAMVTVALMSEHERCKARSDALGAQLWLDAANAVGAASEAAREEEDKLAE